MARAGGNNLCRNCAKWWPEPLVENPEFGICRRDMDFDFANMAGRVHRTESLHECADFSPRLKVVGADSRSGGMGLEPALPIRLLTGAVS